MTGRLATCRRRSDADVTTQHHPHQADLPAINDAPIVPAGIRRTKSAIFPEINHDGSRSRAPAGAARCTAGRNDEWAQIYRRGV